MFKVTECNPNSKPALASIAVTFLILSVGLACVYSGYLVDDFVSLLLAILFKNVAMSTAFVYRSVVFSYTGPR